MARKTNKTSHVLNLITNGAPAEPEPKQTETPEAEAAASAGGGAAPDAAGKGQEPAAVPNQAGDRKVIVVDASENDKIADAIRERLEEQAELDEKNAETQVPDVAVSAAVPVKNGAVDADALMDAVDSMMPEAVDMMSKAEAKAEAAETVAAAETEKEDAAADAAASGSAAAAEKKAPRKHNYRMVNVMEEVVDRYDLSAQMTKYGVCTCSRCHADVQALTLTHLPSKYVVVDGNPIAPIIGYYESKYRSRLLTEVMKACILVKEKPRHNRGVVPPEVMDS